MKITLRTLFVLLLIAAWCAPAASAQSEEEIRAEEIATTTPIKHFITVMQENHTFDNYFGTYPGADGVPFGTCIPISTAFPEDGCVEPYPLSGQAIADLGHSDDVFVAQFNGGKMDGFVEAFQSRNPGAGRQAMGYYDDKDLPYYWNVADNFVLFDRFFTSSTGGSVRNHFYWISGSPGNSERDSLRPEGFDDVPTIFDSLQAKGIPWKFYVQNYDPEITFRSPAEGNRGAQLVWVPVLNYNRFLDDPELNSRIVSLEQFYVDLANGNLPAVSYIVPSGASEHPPGSIQAGERFIRALITSIMRSPEWDNTAFTWTYDDWGGWYDHVPPPRVDEFGYGFRAPALLVSPYAKKGFVDSTTLDFTSMLKFIEENWGLEPLAERDAAANNLLNAFDFEAPPRRAILLNGERVIEVVKRPNAKVVYASYGSVIGPTLALAAAGALSAGRSRRKAALRAAVGST